jgi:hypothetical protein
MNRAILILFAAVVGCSSTPPVPPASAVIEVATAPALRIGEVHVYELDWRTEATREEQQNVSGGVTLQGELAVSAIAHERDGTRVAVWFPSLPTRDVRVMGETIGVEEATLVGPRAELIVAADGDVRRAFFDRGAPPIFRELMTGVIARVDLRAASAGDGPRRIRGGHGLVEATYRRQADGAVTRELARILRFDTAPGADVDASAVTSTGRIELDDAGVPTLLELHDSVEMIEGIGLAADERFSLHRLRVDPATVTELVDPIEIDPTAGPDLDEAARELDRQYADGFTMQDLGITMDVMDGGVLPRTGEFSRAAAMLRGWPERAAEIEPLALRALDGGRQLAFDVLAAAGTRQAQEVMCSLLEDPRAATWKERVLLVQRFAFVRMPTSATGEFMLELLAELERTGDDEMRRATLHPLGVVAGRVSDAWLAERMHDALVDAAAHEDAGVRAAAVAGLGNARRIDDVDRLLDAVDDEDHGVRVEAVAALRTRVTPETTAALLGALADDSPAVASRALIVLRKRHFEGIADPTLVEHARAGRYNAQIDRSMASALVGHREDAEVRVALAAIAERTTDRELAAALRTTLEDA